MNKYLSILKGDFKNILRDPTLLLMLFVPLLILFVVRFGVPLLENQFPLINNYYKEIVSLFALLSAVIPGFVVSFILLDEKDLHLFPVINITPVSLSGFLISRLVFMLIFGFLSSLLLLIFNGLYTIEFIKSCQLALLCALNTPILILIITAKAKNKVEGLTLLKLAMLTLIIPIIIFFLDNTLEYALAFLPASWVYLFLDNSQNQTLIFIIGTLYLVGVTYLSFKLMLKHKT
jgi:fluoroquinolone transport system permease protein